jgi:hypothetical protein
MSIAEHDNKCEAGASGCQCFERELQRDLAAMTAERDEWIDAAALLANEKRAALAERDAARLAALREVREIVEGFNVGAYAEYGRAGTGMLKKGVVDTLDVKIAKEEGK